MFSVHYHLVNKLINYVTIYDPIQTNRLHRTVVTAANIAMAVVLKYLTK